MNVYQKLNNARDAFHQSKLKKTGQNKFAGYSYFELSDFIIPALEIFKIHGLAGIVSFGKEIASLKIINVEKPEEFILIESPMSTAALKGCHEVQNLGAVQTYLRRYLWVAALEIVEHDALDATVGRKSDVRIITPRGGIGDDLDPDIKEYLRELAAQVEDLVSQQRPKEALFAMERENLEADQKVWLFNQLDSKVRTALKKAKETK
jgi:hypothetical protein